MALNIRMQTQSNRLKPKITVIGVGGAGGNAVNNMIHSGLEGCEFLVCNTDAQALEGNSSPHKIQMGVNITRGLGAGANPEIGRAAAEESIEEILAYLEGSNMAFVTCGMGGGTGTGAAPVIAQAAREAGILTVGVITKPFSFEGTHRMKLAENGIAELQRHVDTLIVIPNQNLFRIANEKTTFADAFKMADEVLQSGVRGVTDLMVMPGDINLDFADIRAVMAEMGKAMMGTGEAEGERRAIDAAEKAISNPLLDDVSLKGAKGVLINIMGSRNDITLFEVDEAANRVREEVDPDANIIFGSTFDDTLQGRIRVSVVATGIDAANSGARPLNLAGSNVEPSRRGVQPQTRTGSYGTPGYTAYERPAPRQPAESFGTVPASIIPSQALRQPAVQAAAPAPLMSQRVNAPVMQAQQAAPVSQAAQAPVTAAADGWERSPEPQVQTGHAATTGYAPAAATATARKLDEQMDETQTWTRPTTPPVTQNYPQRAAAAPAAQPRAERHGGSFIPPKPVDPRGNALTGATAGAAASSSADLFAEPAAPARAEEKPQRKSPSLFERFTLQRGAEVTAPAPAAPKMEVSPKLSVEEGGKQAEDELDIPAFLRRQAN